MKSFQAAWRRLDRKVQSWWPQELVQASEAEVRADPKGTLLFLPFPYCTASGGKRSFFAEMYGWDTYFINQGLLAHGRRDIVKFHIQNQLFMISRFGFVLNVNRSYYTTRSQPPLLAQSLRELCQQKMDLGLVTLAYPLLKREFEGFWTSGPHQTPSGLSTNYDGEKGRKDHKLLCECETGLDHNALFDGDIEKTNPLITNFCIIKYADALAFFAGLLGLRKDAAKFKAVSKKRGALIQKYCWNETDGIFYEYNWKARKQIKKASLCSYLSLWTGVATKAQAKRLVQSLGLFEHRHGLSFTPYQYPSPYPRFSWLQWGYPSGWPPMHLWIVQSLDAYGYKKDAQRIAGKFLNLIVSQWKKTGKIWEKYNVVEGSLKFPLERYKLPELHGWTSACVAVLGRLVFK